MGRVRAVGVRQQPIRAFNVEGRCRIDGDDGCSTRCDCYDCVLDLPLCERGEDLYVRRMIAVNRRYHIAFSCITTGLRGPWTLDGAM